MNIPSLIAQGVTFFIFIWIVAKFVWPPLTQAMEERRKKIADGLAAGEAAQKDLEAARADVENLLQEARRDATQIREQAQSQASKIKEQAKAEATSERKRQLEAAEVEVQQLAVKAREEIAGKVAALAVQGAEQVLKREIDAKAHKEILNDLAAQL